MAIDNLEEGRRKLRAMAVGAKVAIAIVTLSSVVTGVLSLLTANGMVIDAVEYLVWDYSAPFLVAQLCLVVSVFPVGMWIYRAHANLDAADLPGLEYSPGWSIGWFAVPIANLWKPFSAMRELWNASHGAIGDYSGTAPGVLWVWWLGWLLSSFSSDTVESGLNLLGSAATVVSAVALWVIVDAITRVQDSIGLDEVFA